jgi:L-alanine-DL-glutamate epimerase-like enolase superfamily enzyme
MIETSIGITAAAHLAGLADWLDLDAPLLITNDPFDGIRYDDRARITLPDRPGIGCCVEGIDRQERQGRHERHEKASESVCSLRSWRPSRSWRLKCFLE